MANLCQYSGALGEPGVGFHTHFAGYAIGDILGTVALAAVVAHMTNRSFIAMFIVLIIIAIFLHWLFCVPTTLNKQLSLV